MNARVFGFAGYSGSGKTTLIEQCIPRFIEIGLSVSLIKHSHHGFDVDQPGKDSWRHRQAGAGEVLLSSRQRWVLMHEVRDAVEPSLDEQLKRLSPCDLVLVEGFKHAPVPKIEVHRHRVGKPLLWPQDKNIIAVASDEPLQAPLPWFDLNNPAAVAQFVVKYLEISNEK